MPRRDAWLLPASHTLGDKAIPAPCGTKSSHFGEQIWGMNTNSDDTNLGGSFYCYVEG